MEKAFRKEMQNGEMKESERWETCCNGSRREIHPCTAVSYTYCP